MVLATYALAGGKPVRVPWFNSDSSKNLSRHYDNDGRNDQKDAVNTLANSILLHGLLMLVRAFMVATCESNNPANPGRCFLLAGATTTEGFYDANQREPTNPNVMATLERGVDLVLIDNRSPSDVLIYIKDTSNSLLEVYNKTNIMESLNIVEKMSLRGEMS